MPKRKRLKIYFLSALIFVVLAGIGAAAQNNSKSAKKQDQADLLLLFSDVKNAVQTKKFNLLKKYVSDNGRLYWAQCNTDVSTDFTFSEIVHELKGYSKGVNIAVADHDMTFIETEGWSGEYPYFYFQFTKENKKWRWLGVCFDAERSLDYRMELGGKDKYYDSPPKLPRQGARVFQDIIALKIRVIEILKFKAFDALESYATKGKLLVGKSCPATIPGDELMKAGVPVKQVIGLMKEKAMGAKEVIPDKGWSYKNSYFNSYGWPAKKQK
jgi:hypothetical protein